MPYADNEGPDQTAHSRSLIWPFLVHEEPMNTLQYHNQHYQTGQICRMVWVIFICIWAFFYNGAHPVNSVGRDRIVLSDEIFHPIADTLFR